MSPRDKTVLAAALVLEALVIALFVWKMLTR